MTARADDMTELRRGLDSIASAIRPIVHVGDGSGRFTPIGSGFAVSHEGVRYLITADHVLAGLSDKMMGVDEQFSTKWPRNFSRLVANDPSLPDADVAWVEIQMFEQTQNVGAAIPLEQTVARVSGGDSNGFFVIGHPVSKARMVDAQSAVRSKLMMAQVRIASEAVKAALGVDERVQMVFSYDAETSVDPDGHPVVRACPDGMSGGVVVATTRAQDGEGREYMKPYVIGVLTHYSEAHRSFKVTKIEHLWIATGLVRGDTEALYRKFDGTYTSAR